MLGVRVPTNFALGLAMIVGLGALGAVAAAQQPQEPPPLLVMPLRGNVYWTQGGTGGNTGFAIGKSGVIVVDTKTTVDSSQDVQAEIAKITSKPVTVAILTHSDGDHVNGLAGFAPGLTIIAQENCKKEMRASAGRPNAAPQDRLPTETVDKDETLTIEGVHIRMLHYAPAHTSGDLIVFFPDQKIVFTGDLITTVRPEPLIHVEKDGTAAGWIESVRGLLSLNADTFVTGHGTLQTRAEVQNKLSVVEVKWSKISAMVTQGKSLDDVKTALGESTAPADPGPNGNPPAPTFTEIIYKELSKKT